MSEADSIVPRWYAAHTKPRHEKTAALHLQNRSIESYVAAYDSVRHWNGRRAVVRAPLFPGYLFVNIRSSDRGRVLEVPGILSIVGFSGRITPLPEGEIEALRVALQARRASPCPYLGEGDCVRITRGPLKGLEGMVVRQTRRLRMVVSIDCIMKSFEVELEAGDLVACTPRQNARRVGKLCV